MMRAEAGRAPSRAQYGDSRSFELPRGWTPLEETMCKTALVQTRRAFETEGPQDVLARLERYYDPEGPYAGATFLSVDPQDDFAITAADLWAVSTLSMEIPPNAGRRLLRDTELSNIVQHKLRRLPTDARLTDLTPDLLDDMYDLYDAIRTMLPPLGRSEQTNQWVLASKLCARKRPDLFPVRDSKVCAYLADNHKLGGQSDQLGRFIRDIQAFGYVLTHPEIQALLGQTRDEFMAHQPAWPVDWSDLRFLDVVLWTRAVFTTH